MSHSPFHSAAYSFTAPSSPSTANKNSLRYKENVAALFQKLNTLQHSCEMQKSKKNCDVLNEFSKKETKVSNSNKQKAEQFKSILRAVCNIEKQIENQKNEEEKLRHNVQKMIQSTRNQLELNFQRLEKQRIRNENNLQQWIEGKLESFILKNKNAWKQESQVKPESFLEEINHQQKEHSIFLENYGKQLSKLKKQTTSSLQDLLKSAEEEVSKDYQSEVSNFMKTVHMEVNSKLRGLEQQRNQTQERVLQVLERVVASCIPEPQF